MLKYIQLSHSNPIISLILEIQLESLSSSRETIIIDQFTDLNNSVEAIFPNDFSSIDYNTEIEIEISNYGVFVGTLKIAQVFKNGSTGL